MNVTTAQPATIATASVGLTPPLDAPPPPMVAGCAVAPVGTAARRRGGYVRVPLAVVAALSGLERAATALAVAAVLYDVQSGRSGVSTIGQDRLMARLGRAGHKVDAVREAVRTLRSAGVVTTERTGRGAGRYRYRLTSLAGKDGHRWSEIPRPLMDALAATEITPATLRVWLDLDQALGRGGRTSDSDAQIAARLGSSPRTVRRHIALLASLGFIRLRIRADNHRMIHRVDLLAAGPVPDDASALDPVDKTAGSRWTKTRGPCGGALAPEDQAPEKPSSSGLPDGRHLRDACDRDDAAAKTPSDPSPTPAPHDTSTRPTSAPKSASASTSPSPTQKPRKAPRKARKGLQGGASADHRVRYVLGGLDLEYRTGPNRRWLGGVAAAVLAALTASPVALTPDACRRALSELLDVDTHGGRTVPAVREALALLAAETRNGLACRVCGRDEPRFIDNGLCCLCAPQPLDLDDPGAAELPPVAERRAVYEHFGLPTDNLPEDPSEEAPDSLPLTTQEIAMAHIRGLLTR